MPVGVASLAVAHEDDDDEDDEFHFHDPSDQSHATDGQGSEDEFDDDDWPSDDDLGAITPGSRSSAGPSTPSRSSQAPDTPTSSSAKTPTQRRTPSAKRKTPSKAKSSATSGPFIRQTASDAYFNNIARPARASSNVFSSLLPPLTHANYTSLLQTSDSAKKHLDEIAALEDAHEVRWDGWVDELLSGWNLLFYGLGSKKGVLDIFLEERLAEEGDCIVVNGLFPRIGIRDILHAIESAMPDVASLPGPLTTVQTTPADALAYKIYSYFLPDHVQTPFPKASRPLFILIHSIDSPSLLKARPILSLLASSPRIHLLASVDHIHAPTIFSSTQSASRPHEFVSSAGELELEWRGEIPPGRGFNWLWHDLTTMKPYDFEVGWRTSSASRLASNGGGASVASEEGARHILVSVTLPARRLFKLLSLQQIQALSTDGTAPPPSPSSSSAPSSTPAHATEVDTFYHLCAEKWIARQEVRFKALLSEFKDHRLILESTVAPAGALGDEDGEVDEEVRDDDVTGGNQRKGVRGKANARWLWIPLGKEALVRLVEELADVEFD